MLIGLSGYAQAGKDTVGSILVSDYGYQRAAFADRLKNVAYATNPRVRTSSYSDNSSVRLAPLVDRVGWEEAKGTIGVREYLQDLGVAARTFIHPDVWVHALLDNLETTDRVVITDVRFPNEAQVIRNLGGEVWRIDRSRNPINQHESERALDQFDFDRTILNRGTLADLREAVLNSVP